MRDEGGGDRRVTDKRRREGKCRGSDGCMNGVEVRREGSMGGS